MSSILLDEDRLFLLFSGIDSYFLIQGTPSNQFKTKCNPIQKNFLPNISIDTIQNRIQEEKILPIARMAKHTVWIKGTGPMLVLKESPNLEEDRTGIPYKGIGEHIVQSFLQYLGFSDDSLCLMNLVPWRPPGGRCVTQEEAQTGWKLAKEYIAIHPPRIILTLGKIPLKACLALDSLSRVRGQIQLSPFGPILPTIAPSLLVDSAIHRKTLWQDLLKIKYYLSKI